MTRGWDSGPAPQAEKPARRIVERALIREVCGTEARKCDSVAERGAVIFVEMRHRVVHPTVLHQILD
jgi:hypothetical protein